MDPRRERQGVWSHPDEKNPLKYYGKGCLDIQVTNANNGHKKKINKKPMEGKCLHPKPKKEKKNGQR